MAANTTPIYARAPDIQWGSTDGDGGAAGPLKTANTLLDGTGTVLTVFTADATNGGMIRGIHLKAAGTNVATVLRIFINNGSTNATVANNSYFDELTLASTAASNLTATMTCEWAPPGGILQIKPGYKILVTIGTTVAAGWQVTVYGGAY